MTTLLALEIPPYFCFKRQGWVPYVWSWDPVTGFFARAEGEPASERYEHAAQASRFLGRCRST